MNIKNDFSGIIDQNNGQEWNAKIEINYEMIKGYFLPAAGVFTYK